MIQVAFLVRSFNESPEVVRSSLTALDESLGSHPDWNSTVVLVDDGSWPPLDGLDPKMALNNADLVLVRHPIQLGPGAALETAMEFVRRGTVPVDVAATFDPDGQHDPVDLCGMIGELLSSGVDPAHENIVIMGSRFLGKAPNMHPRRRRLLLAARWLIRLFYGYQLTDAHNGLRVFTRRALDLIHLKSSDFSYASELLAELRKSGAEIREFPVTIRYTDYSRTKGQKDSNAFSILKEMLLRKLIP